MLTFVKPKLVVSKCFFERTRYDGGEIKEPVVEKLKPYLEFLLVCPEVEIGLSVPRPKVQIILDETGKHLIQEGTGLDLTASIQKFSRTFLSSLPEIDGFILKSRSPSCGLGSAKFYREGKVAGRTYGFFAERVKKQYCLYPLADEGKLKDREFRDLFFTRIFALAELRTLKEKNSYNAIVEFHQRHKYLLLALSQKHLRRLGQIVARGDLSLKEKIFLYERLFREALSKTGTRPSHYNALLHLYGHFAKRLNGAEKLHLQYLLGKFRRGLIILSSVRDLLRLYALRFDSPYLLSQSYLYPYPEALHF